MRLTFVRTVLLEGARYTSGLTYDVPPPLADSLAVGVAVPEGTLVPSAKDTADAHARNLARRAAALREADDGATRAAENRARRAAQLVHDIPDPVVRAHALKRRAEQLPKRQDGSARAIVNRERRAEQKTVATSGVERARRNSERRRRLLAEG